MKLRLALPKGRLMEGTASLLRRGGLALDDYENGSRSYRPRSTAFPELVVKVFQEKDIPIQVAIGNYDVGICGLDWVEEYLVKFPKSPIVRLVDLGWGSQELTVVAAKEASFRSVQDLVKASASTTIRIVSEYANLAEAFVFQNRLRRFLVFPVWGAAEAYLPENAEVALVANGSPEELAGKGLTPIARLLTAQAVLIANRDSFTGADLSPFLTLVQKGERCHGP